MNLNPVHPLTVAFNAIAPVVGANFNLRSARDAELPVNKYPLLDYVVHREGESQYDSSRKAWRVKLVVQLDYLLEESDVKQCIPEKELEESQAVQGIQYSLTSKIRALIQLLINPSSLGAEFKEQDFIWSAYGFKLERFIESVYFRNHGADSLSGASSLFILSLLDVDNTICCVPENEESLVDLLMTNSISRRLLLDRIENS